MVRIRSLEHPEQAMISALVDTTERSRARDPTSLVSSEERSSLRQTTTRQISSPFQNRKDMNLLVPLSSNSRAKHCSVATCSAISPMTQLKKCWKIAWNGNEPFNTQANLEPSRCFTKETCCHLFFAPIKVAENSLMIGKWTDSRPQVT